MAQPFQSIPPKRSAGYAVAVALAAAGVIFQIDNAYHKVGLLLLVALFLWVIGLFTKPPELQIPKQREEYRKCDVCSKVTVNRLNWCSTCEAFYDV